MDNSDNGDNDNNDNTVNDNHDNNNDNNIDNHNYHNKTAKKRRRIFVRQNLLLSGRGLLTRIRWTDEICASSCD